MIEPQNHNTNVWHAWMYCYVWNVAPKDLPVDVAEYWGKIALTLAFWPFVLFILLPELLMNIIGSIPDGYVHSDNGTWQEYVDDLRIGLEVDSFGEGDNRADTWVPVALVTYGPLTLLTLLTVLVHWAIPLTLLAMVGLFIRYLRYKHNVPKSSNPKITWHNDDEYTI